MDLVLIIMLILLIIVMIVIISFLIYWVVCYQRPINNEETIIYCNDKGRKQDINPIPYHRISQRSTGDLISNDIPLFNQIENNYQHNNRTRSFTNRISPNWWPNQELFREDSYFLNYPYYGKIENNGIYIYTGATAIDEPPTIEGDHLTLIPRINSFKITSLGNQSVSRDILDMDAFLTYLSWQYNDGGLINIPLIQGCPYITIEVNNTRLNFECQFDFSLINYQENKVWKLEISDNDGYLILLDREMILQKSGKIITYPNFMGVTRIAYYQTDTIQLLIDNYNYYPVESTVNVNSTVGSICNTSTEITYSFIKKYLVPPIDTDHLLMLKLPHQNITNISYQSVDYYHPLIGPYNFIYTDDDSIKITNSYNICGIDYPIITNYQNDAIVVWNIESANLINEEPNTTNDWIRWLGSLSDLILIGQSLQVDTDNLISLVRSRLIMIKNNNIVINDNQTNFINFSFDKTWGGIIDKTGTSSCNSSIDNGNSFYNHHIENFGYLIYSYAVISHIDPQFISDNLSTMLYFVRTVMNPSDSDSSFPLWRSKNWYLGFSSSAGFNRIDTTNTGELIFSYYACYLLSTVINNQNIINWSLGMLISEINAIQYYFQFSSFNIIDVNESYIEGTITNRNIDQYSMTSSNGNLTYPERYASLMVSLSKPLNNISTEILNENWLESISNYLISSITPQLQSESLLYAYVLLNNVNAIPSIVNNANIKLPYGSTWTSGLFKIASSN